MDENLTAQADFLGNLSLVLIVLWIVGGAFFLLAHNRGDAVSQQIAATAAAAATPAPAAQ